MYGAGEFGSVTVLSPDPESGFPIWETTSRIENRECNFMGVVEVDSDYYGFLVEHMGYAQTTSGVSIMSWITTSSIRIIPTSMTFSRK